MTKIQLLCVLLSATGAVADGNLQWTVMHNTDFHGNVMVGSAKTDNVEDCARLCLAVEKCAAATWNGPSSKYADSNCNLHCRGDNPSSSANQTSIQVKAANLCDKPSPEQLKEIPEDWREAYDRGDLLWTSEEDKVQHPPEIGNGFVGTIVGSSKLYTAGVFNGQTSDPQGPQRAEITSPVDVGLNGAVIAVALDLRHGVYIRRYSIRDNIIDLCFYAHRSRRSILVVEIRVVSSNSQQPLNVELMHRVMGSLENPSELDFSWTVGRRAISGADTTTWKGSIHRAETEKLSRTSVAVVLSTISKGSVVRVSPGSPKKIVVAVRTSLESENPLTAAMHDWKAAHRMNSVDLFAEHSGAWAALWESGMEVQGRVDVTRAISSSLYYLLSAIRKDTVHSLSPGGLASNDYRGHTFWDVETWMYPPLLVWHPSIAESILQFRVDQVDGAKAKARSYKQKYKGAMFPWEAAASGQEACPDWGHTGKLEQHITGDVAFAVQQYWYATQDLDWLRKVYPALLRETAEFWRSRVSIEHGVAHIRGVVPPDEYRINGVNDSVYTNFVAKQNLRFSAEAGEILGEEEHLRKQWLKIADAIPILFDEHAGIHPEFEGYNGSNIKQADVVMLNFPLMMNMSDKVRRADLEYYAPKTDESGPAMTQAIHAISYMELGAVAEASAEFNKSFAPAQSPFLVWLECPTCKPFNFITGAGGFLQTTLFGLLGLRIMRTHLVIKPIMLEGMKLVKARGIHYRGIVFDLSCDKDNMIFSSKSRASFWILKDGAFVHVAAGSSVTMLSGYAEVQVQKPASSSQSVNPDLDMILQDINRFFV